MHCNFFSRPVADPGDPPPVALHGCLDHRQHANRPIDPARLDTDTDTLGGMLLLLGAEAARWPRGEVYNSWILCTTNTQILSNFREKFGQISKFFKDLSYLLC